MKRKRGMCFTLAAACLAGYGFGGAALALDEDEANFPNHPIQSARSITVPRGGSVVIHGVIGNASGKRVEDADFYSFHAHQGDAFEFDIDDGMKTSGWSVNTNLSVFLPDAPAHTRDDFNDDMVPGEVDEGSNTALQGFRDAHIAKYVAKATGVHTVGVSSWPRVLLTGGVYGSTSMNLTSNGTYTLIITNLTPPVLQIGIAIKPGSGEYAPMNAKSRGKVPVALISADNFDALTVVPESLTFGATGDEKSLSRCGKEGTDVNDDGRLDLVCHFEYQLGKFDEYSDRGVLKGETRDGTKFEGNGWLKVVPKRHKD